MSTNFTSKPATDGHLPVTAITMGDPAGVGPELCLRLLANLEIASVCTPVVFGDVSVLQTVALKSGLPMPEVVWNLDEFRTRRSGSTGLLRTESHPPQHSKNLPFGGVVDLNQIDGKELSAGKVNRQTGAASFVYIGAAIDAALAGQVDAVVTGPIHKEAWQAAEIPFPGHTELFAKRCQTDRFCMMMTAPAFSTSLVTTHVGYDQVPRLLTTELILKVTELTHEALTKIYGRKPRLTMLGLNPHAGEGGLFGNREEETIIAPAADQARQKGIEIGDPLPPDTAFLPWRREQTDGYICMYHDQGLIPFKAFNFDTGVNITLGLPIIRTSVDHGTALDIAWQGKADDSSLIAAVRLAASLATSAT